MQDRIAGTTMPVLELTLDQSSPGLGEDRLIATTAGTRSCTHSPTSSTQRARHTRSCTWTFRVTRRSDEQCGSDGADADVLGLVRVAVDAAAGT